MKDGIDVSEDGTKSWHINGDLHREDGPAIEHADGTRKWYTKGKLHRIDGPAVVRVSGSRTWWVNDEIHREDGPAFEVANGPKYWYIKGVKMTLDEFIKKAKNKKFTADEIASLQSYGIEVDN
jgi:hypothetical protein